MSGYVFNMSGEEGKMGSTVYSYNTTALQQQKLCNQDSGFGTFKKKNQKQPLYLVVGTSCARGNCVDEKFGRKYVMCQGDIL